MQIELARALADKIGEMLDSVHACYSALSVESKASYIDIENEDRSAWDTLAFNHELIIIITNKGKDEIQLKLSDPELFDKLKTVFHRYKRRPGTKPLPPTTY